jgi:hypothetical protein
MQFFTFCLHIPIWEKRPVYFAKEAKFFARFVIIFPTLRFLRRNDNLVEKIQPFESIARRAVFFIFPLKKDWTGGFFCGRISIY